MKPDRASTVVAWLILATLIIFGIMVAVGNYHECRSAHFSRVYCATTHLVR